MEIRYSNGNKTDFYRIYILSSLSPLHSLPSFMYRSSGEAVALHSLWGLRAKERGGRFPQTIGTGSDFMQSESIPPLLSPYTFDNPIPLFKQARLRLGIRKERRLSPAKTLLFVFIPSLPRRYMSPPPPIAVDAETRPPTSLVSINNARPARKTNVEAAPIYCPTEQTRECSTIQISL